MSPSFHFNWLGGAGVVSKDIDPKPFYESLTSIMTNAYRFAKAGKNISGTGPATGVLHLISVFLTAFTDFINSSLTQNYFEVFSPCQFTSSSYYSHVLFSLPLSCPLFFSLFPPLSPSPFLSFYLSFFLSFFTPFSSISLHMSSWISLSVSSTTSSPGPRGIYCETAWRWSTLQCRCWVINNGHNNDSNDIMYNCNPRHLL